MEERAADFLSGGLLLEGILAVPEGAGPFPAVIVCHPHPLYGGSMDNNVVSSLCQMLTQEALAAFKFNFRGVGASQGEFDRGIGEGEDASAAISFISTFKEVDPDRVGLTGYSAGAGFALPVGSNDRRIKALVAISPPLAMFDFGFLRECPKPKLLISGSEDDFTAIDRFVAFCRSLPEPREYESIEGADHLWSRYESRLAAKVTAFFTRVL